MIHSRYLFLVLCFCMAQWIALEHACSHAYDEPANVVERCEQCLAGGSLGAVLPTLVVVPIVPLRHFLVAQKLPTGRLALLSPIPTQRGPPVS